MTRSDTTEHTDGRGTFNSSARSGRPGLAPRVEIFGLSKSSGLVSKNSRPAISKTSQFPEPPRPLYGAAADEWRRITGALEAVGGLEEFDVPVAYLAAVTAGQVVMSAQRRAELELMIGRLSMRCHSLTGAERTAARHALSYLRRIEVRAGLDLKRALEIYRTLLEDLKHCSARRGAEVTR